jgi:hypothetical protein
MHTHKKDHPFKSFWFKVGVILLILNFPMAYLVAIPVGVWMGVHYGHRIGLAFGLSLYALSWVMMFAGSSLAGKDGWDYARWYWRHRMLKIDRLKRWKELRAVRLAKVMVREVEEIGREIGREVKEEVQQAIGKIEHRHDHDHHDHHDHHDNHERHDHHDQGASKDVEKEKKPPAGQ